MNRVHFQVPGLGHIPNIIKAMSSSNDGVIKSAVQAVHILSANEVRLLILVDLFVCLSSFLFK